VREHELQLEEYKADLTYRIRRTEELKNLLIMTSLAFLLSVDWDITLFGGK